MKILFLIVFCALFSLNIFGQTESNEENAADAATAAVEEISLARDDENGSPGEITDNFLTTDVPTHCLINLTSTKSATVKMNLVAIAANGYKPETIVISVSYRTKGNQNRVRFKVSPDGGVWAEGKYRADVLIDGRKSGSKVFEIRKSPKDSENEKPTVSKPKPKSAKIKRKN